MKKTLLMAICLLMGLMAEAQDIVKRYAFEGTLGGKTQVRLAFEVNSVDIVAGAIYYPKAKNPAQILMVGSSGGNGMYYLRECQDNGYVTGYLTLEIKNGKLTGVWINPKTDKELAFTNMKSISFPEGFGGKLVPESPDHIGKEYGYTQYNRNYEEDMGGSATFIAAGKNRVHFKISNCPQNIAEGESEKGRPAVLEGNHFKYLHVNECDYGFEAYFYPRFVVLKSVTDYETFECFGQYATFQGAYIKTKE